LGKRLFQRQPGEVLHPARESLDTLSKIRREIGEYNFASQYQQNPTPLGGAVVRTEWIRYYEPGSEPGKFSFTFQSWDTANKAGELNDYSVCTTWGVNRKDFYLLDVFRKRLNYPDLKRAVIELKNRYHPHAVLIEDKASGTQLIQELKLEGLRIKSYLPPSGTDKLMRLHTEAISFENGHVFVPKQAPWLNEYIAELTSFPGTKFDDQVDSTTQFLDYMRKPGARPMVISEEVLRRARETRRRRLSSGIGNSGYLPWPISIS
jgi:predicted phage terminase large subunit-like protein